MAYKPTGKPVGRPKTKEYVTLLARVPADLAELVKKYAGEHRISVATVLREGAEWRIGDGDPRHNGMYLDQPTGIREQVYHSNTGNSTAAPQTDEALQEVRALLARQWEQIQALAQALERQKILPSDGVYSSNTEKSPSVPPVAMAPKVNVDKEEVIARIQQMRDKGLDSTQIAETLQAEGVPTLSAEAQLQAAVDMLEHREVQGSSGEDTSITSADGDMPAASMEAQSTSRQTPAEEDTRGSVPPYDPAKYHLGTLCPRNHEWSTTGQSLRNLDNQCLKCKAQAKREKDAAKREAKREAQLATT
jgi:hypothetical protein